MKAEKNPSPANGRLRLPAEWEPHEATWLAWPHHQTDWPGKLSAIHWVYVELVRKLVPHECVRILVNDREHERRGRRYLSRGGVQADQVEFFRIPTNRGWIRDFGPMFVKRDLPQPTVAIAPFRFKGWARYADWRKDDAVHGRVASQLGIPMIPSSETGSEVVLEGGGLEVNGCGTLLATEECWLDPVTQVRNPGWTTQEYETLFRQILGATNVLWLGKGIAGDDTHGHVDDFCRFVNPRTVVLCQEKNVQDANYRPLAENRERLEGMVLEDGTKPQLIPFPMPAPLYLDGRRLPASYANFYISNRAVLVPTFNDPHDRLALGLLAEVFPDRPVIGIHAVDLVWGLGTIHCLTQQQPALSS